MQLNGLGLYQANTLDKPWNNSATSKDLATTGKGSSLFKAGLGALAGATKTAPVAAPKSVTPITTNTIDGFGDELQVSPTANTRAEIAVENMQSQTAQAAVTTANSVNDSLGKTSAVLSGMQSIASKLSEPSLTASKRAELSATFDALSKHLDSLVESESFAGHKVLDGRFRATFTLGDSAKVTVDATLPNGKGFTADGLGVEGFANLLSSPAAVINKTAGSLVSKGLDIAQGAVAQVREGLNEAANSTVQEMQSSSKLLSANIGGSKALAASLVSAAMTSLADAPAAAFAAQANTPTISALRLLA